MRIRCAFWAFRLFGPVVTCVPWRPPKKPHRQVRTMTGAGWTTLGTAGTGVNQFKYPRGIFVHGARRTTWQTWVTRVVRVNDMMGAGWMTLRTSGFPNGIFVNGQTGSIVAESLNMFDGLIVRMNDMTGAGQTTLRTRSSPGIFVR